MPCTYTYKGKVYSEAEWAAFLRKEIHNVLPAIQDIRKFSVTPYKDLRVLTAKFPVWEDAVHPVTNERSEQLATLHKTFEKGSFYWQELLRQPAPQIADSLRELWEPMLQELVKRQPGSKVVNTLTKTRRDGPFKRSPAPLLDQTNGQLDESALLALASELKGRSGPGSEATARLRQLIWQSAGSNQPQVLTAYREMLTREGIIDEDGGYQLPDPEQERQDTVRALQMLNQTKGNTAAAVIKTFLQRKWVVNTLLPETVAKMLAGPDSTLRQILIDGRRKWQERRDELLLRRERQINRAEAVFKELSTFGAAKPTSGVIALSFQGWSNGKATEIKLPVSQWIDLYLTARSQLSTTARLEGKAYASALADLDDKGRLIAKRNSADSDGQVTGKQYGYVYTTPEGKKQRLLITPQTYQQLEQTLQNQYAEALQVVSEFYTDEVGRHYMSKVFEVENGKPLLMEEDYYPLSAYVPAAARNSVPQGGGLLESLRLLSGRKTPPLEVSGMDVLHRMRRYSRDEATYVGNSIVRLNLTRWRQRNAEVLEEAPSHLVEYLITLEKDLNDPERNAAIEQELEGNLKGINYGLRAWMHRYTKSVFGFNLTTPVKNLTTFLNGYGLGIIEDRYLHQASKDLLRLGMDAYRVAQVQGNRDILGLELSEGKYLEEMSQNKYLQSVLYRAIGSSEAYLGNSMTREDFKDEPVASVLEQSKQVIDALNSYALRWVAAADRAAIISFWRASQYQVQDKIANGLFLNPKGGVITSLQDDAAQREIASLTTRMIYATNNMPGEGNMSQIQRSRTVASSLLTLFASQQIRLTNTVISAFLDYMHLEADPNASAEAVQAALKRAGWTATSLLFFNSLLMALINALVKSFTSDNDPSTYTLDIAIDTTIGLAGILPSLPSAALTSAITLIDGRNWSDQVLDYAPAQAFADVVEGTRAAVDYLAAEDEADREKRFSSLAFHLADGGTKLTSLPNQLPKLLLKLSKDEPIEGKELEEGIDLDADLD